MYEPPTVYIVQPTSSFKGDVSPGDLFIPSTGEVFVKGNFRLRNIEESSSFYPETNGLPPHLLKRVNLHLEFADDSCRRVVLSVGKSSFLRVRALYFKLRELGMETPFELTSEAAGGDKKFFLPAFTLLN